LRERERERLTGKEIERIVAKGFGCWMKEGGEKEIASPSN
jgi:hypothetical protein